MERHVLVAQHEGGERYVHVSAAVLDQPVELRLRFFVAGGLILCVVDEVQLFVTLGEFLAHYRQLVGKSQLLLHAFEKRIKQSAGCGQLVDGAGSAFNKVDDEMTGDAAAVVHKWIYAEDRHRP